MKHEWQRTPLEIAADGAGAVLLFALLTMPIWWRFVA